VTWQATIRVVITRLALRRKLCIDELPASAFGNDASSSIEEQSASYPHVGSA
jgi:hypothetical protein